MTPGGRVAAAIPLLDAILSGAPAERELTKWARGARYAGSSDRAAVRDHVFSALRCLRSFGALGGGTDGRALMVGALRSQDVDLDMIFTGNGYDPAKLGDDEKQRGRRPNPDELRDLPDWLWPHFQAGLGANASAGVEALRHRGPVSLRVNARRSTRMAAQAALSVEGIETRPVDAVKMALHVTGGVRKIVQSVPYRNGLIELQDASSQAAMEAIDLPAGGRVLDYCAGGGGKVLALAARAEGGWFAHDADPRRMADLPARAHRAGVDVRLCETAELAALAPFDMVICDVPCSGSGTWRRAPQAKWTLTPEALARQTVVQRDILREAAALVAPSGALVYATCSVFIEENEAIIDTFLSEFEGWTPKATRRWQITTDGDGFFCAQLYREV